MNGKTFGWLSLSGACVAALATLGCAQAMARDGSVSRNTDEFAGGETIILEKMYVPAEGGRLGLEQLIEFQATAEPRASTALVTISTYSEDGWRYLQCHTLAFQIDGEPQGALETRHNGNVVRGSAVNEAILSDISVGLLARMGQGTTVRGRLCNDIFTFSPEQLRMLRVFVGSIGR